MPIIVIPILSGLIVAWSCSRSWGVPIADFMRFLGEWLKTMHSGNAVLLAALLGAMIAF